MLERETTQVGCRRGIAVVVLNLPSCMRPVLTELPRPVAVLVRALRDVSVDIAPRSKLDPRGIAVNVAGGNATETLTLLWAGEGWPADIASVLAGTPDPWPRDLVVVGRHFSPGALRTLRERDANWVDETGDTRIVGPSRLFVIRLRPRTAPTRQLTDERRFGWSASAVAIAEAILARPNEPVLNGAVAETTTFSAPQISRTLAHFDKRGWTRKSGSKRGRGAHRVLEDGEGLLRDWAAHVASEQRPTTIHAHALFKEPVVFLRENLVPALEQLGAWALSGWVGLELEAPYATQVPTLHVYLPESSFDDGRSDALLIQARLRRVEEGGRVVLWPAAPTILRLRKTARREVLPVVSTPRLYADLLRLGGRGVDAAEHVRETLIEF